MAFNKGKIKISLAIVLLFIGIVAFISKGMLKESRAGLRTRHVVKLYSNGEVVNTWEAAKLGSVDGNSLIIEIGRNQKVRISGTYSVEPSNN